MARYTGVIFKIVEKKALLPWLSFAHLQVLAGFLSSHLPTVTSKKSHSSHPISVTCSCEVAEELKKEKINKKSSEDRWLCHIRLMSLRHKVVQWCQTEAECKHVHVSWSKLCVLKVSRVPTSAHLPSWVIQGPGGSYLWPSSAFISSPVDNGSNNPVSSLSVRGVGIFLGAFEKIEINFQHPSAKKHCFFCVWPQRVCLGKTPLKCHWSTAGPS